jgi:hypothetical protein
MDQNELPLDPHHLGVPSGVPKTIFKPIARLAQTVNLSCREIDIISKRTKMSFHLTHITRVVHRVQPKNISVLVVHLAQTVHLSDADINITSK